MRIKCDRLDMDGTRRGRCRMEKYWGEEIRQDMMQLQDKAKAMIFLRHHMDEGQKVEYLTVKDPLELWTGLKGKYDHLKATVLSRVRYEWMHLRFQDFKIVIEYNSVVFKIVSQLKLCGETINDEDMMEKILTTFHASNVILQQQYREKGFRTRPIGTALLPEANMVRAHVQPEKWQDRDHNNMCGHGNGRGQYNNRRGGGNQRRKNQMGPQNNPLKGDLFTGKFVDCHFDESIYSTLGRKYKQLKHEIDWNALSLSHLDPRINQSLHVPIRVDVPIGQVVNANESKPLLKRGRPIGSKDKNLRKKKEINDHDMMAVAQKKPQDLTNDKTGLYSHQVTLPKGDNGSSEKAVPLFISEIAPTRIRGGLNILFQLNVTIGILFANLVNYGTAKISGGWGWRLSLDLAGFPAALLTLGALFVVDTPNSLIERGRLDEGKQVLRKIRGTDNIEPEFLELVEASRIAKEVKHPFRNLFRRKNRPQLIISVALQIFQQFTGINAIMFYAPVLFSTLGFGSSAALYSAVITGAVNVLSTVVSVYSVDKLGRRVLLLEAGVQMLLSQVIIAIILGIKVTDHSDDLSHGWGIFVVVMICTYVSAFAWSWGPLGWLIPSETFPLETRSAGQSVTVCVNLLFTFIMAQAFLSMLCHFKYGIFLFFSAWIVVMSFFVFFLLPETKNIPIEEMTDRVWKQHWLWKRLMVDEDDNVDVVKKNGYANGYDPSSRL
ncbi:Sugar transport protein 13 [Capsicum annuum]|nr:Sugar transport protein 13 [Capsicum annuum]KAF3682015.1 Sugar transport protein 13 [Capsicum annuum]